MSLTNNSEKCWYEVGADLGLIISVQPALNAELVNQYESLLIDFSHQKHSGES